MDLLNRYQQLCEEIYLLLSQENNLLKQEQVPDQNLLNTKRTLLSKLEFLTEQCKQVGQAGVEDKKQAQRLQQKLMKIFMLDRENEKMLLTLQLKQDTHLSYGNVSATPLQDLHD
ncbi:MAG: hypothetical protein LBF43_00800 [Puniceicoccales bacterium]|jgi:3'-phosphoadenosine 5'-phosphosulfate sulfotransferase|nr:hypothetical protein [Puniceicoccales bacterium]